jgi:hypothetical protein
MIVVEVLVLILRVRRVCVSNGYVAGEFSTSEGTLFEHCAGGGEEEFGCIGAVGCQ